MTRPPRFEIRIAGFGGQGVLAIGRILGAAFTVYGGKNSVNTQSYGPESRGGACRSEVVVSQGEINYPYVRKADVLVALSQVALDAYVDDLKEGGILVTDADAVGRLPPPGRFRMYPVPTMALAREIGDTKCQNAVALGAVYELIQGLLDETALVRALKEGLPPEALRMNLAALERGRSQIQSNLASER